MWETTSRARERIQLSAKAKTVTVAKWEKWRRWRGFRSRFHCRLGVGPVSSKRCGDGGRKTGEDKQPVLTFPFIQILPGVCGKLARTGYGVLPVWATFRSLRQTWGEHEAAVFQGVVLQMGIENP